MYVLIRVDESQLPSSVRLAERGKSIHNFAGGDDKVVPESVELLSSSELAQYLRNGPARPMIDRLVRTVAETAKVEFVTLGLRNDNFYYFIASEGFAFSSSVDQVPAGKLKKSLFAIAIEVPDLSKEPNFRTLTSVPIGNSWRYGANVPIRLNYPLSDGGVLALSVADRQTRAQAGPTLMKLNQMATHFSDVVWLAMQLHTKTKQADRKAAAARVLIEGLRQTYAPMALIDQEFKLIEFSPGLADFQQTALGKPPLIGQSLFETWVDDVGEAAVRKAMSESSIATELISYPDGAGKPIVYDFHTLSFPDARLKLGVFSIHLHSVRESGSSLREPESAPFLSLATAPESPEVVADFLFETLTIRKRLLQRKNHNYLALRTWRSAIKDHQIAALKALKRNPSSTFVERIAIEMRAAVEAVHGNLEDSMVVPVPCGHSGPGCLSELIAAKLAEMIGIPLVAAFEPIQVHGNSHPRTNPKRPKMQLREVPEGRIILVDDVATSGAHLEEAMTLLSRSTKAVWSIAWIAS